MTFWRFAVRRRPEFMGAEGESLKEDMADLGVLGVEQVLVTRIYYVGGALQTEELSRLGELLADPIAEQWEVTEVASLRGATATKQSGFKEVAYRPGVRDPVEDSLRKGAQDLGIRGIQAVHTAKEYLLVGSIPPDQLSRICEKLLANSTIQEIVRPDTLERLLRPIPSSPMAIETVHLLPSSDTVLQRVSLDHQLSLNLEEMRAIQAYFRKEGREPTLLELETLAQTWSEHCKHKTLRGPIVYTEEVAGRSEKRVIQNLLKETIMQATHDLGLPWCVSVFSDNSGVIRFDEQFHLCFKVETHNHPSALEPFGGASTGVGGVIRDILGTGLGAKPVASTDVFCFAPPDFPADQVPPGLLQPRRIIKGVVAGVKDYGNKMGIPTVNGAVLFDDRFLGNPLVYCGNVGLLPAGKVQKRVEPGMAVVVAGGRTGRDGIHGATFSSLALVPESETISSTAVQIGDPIAEKKLADALLEARDRGLFTSVTDCGAGGLSSAVGEMGASCGARVHLERVPLKYAGLTPAEIWISESQERMVLAAPLEKLEELLNLFRERDVEAAAIGEFTDTGRLELLFQGAQVGELKMEFLHEGVPQVTRPARWVSPALQEPAVPSPAHLGELLLKLLSRWDSCSKEWIIRQYDHEVQGGSVQKPLSLGPSDAAVFRPRLDSWKAAVLANGINFRYGDLDPYWMAALAVDEVVRQVVAVGGSLGRLAILDNFCWGDPTRVEVLGSLVRAAQGCADAAKAFGTPFISGKDSLYNEYRVGDRTIQIPGTLLISGLGVIEDARRVISMDAKRPDNFLYLVGWTGKELGGSAYYDHLKVRGGRVPRVDFARAPAQMRAVEKTMAQGWVVSAHDCSEGGLAVAASEMAFAGGLGLVLELGKVPLRDSKGPLREEEILFSESASRLLLEIPPEHADSFERQMSGFPVGRVGKFEGNGILRVVGLEEISAAEVPIERLRGAWEAPFRGW